ncbi:hypothetical protein FW320_24635 [Azospirillum sp. Vi22]|nr:hypothetical protein [Azospirillum baldaniorum]
MYSNKPLFAERANFRLAEASVPGTVRGWGMRGWSFHCFEKAVNGRPCMFIRAQTLFNFGRLHELNRQIG